MLDFWETACDQQAAEEEVHLVKEFKEKLQYNLQQVGSFRPFTQCLHTVEEQGDKLSMCCCSCCGLALLNSWHT